jgi:hypothetical protein
MGFNAGYRGFLEFAAAVGLPLEPFQRKIARAALESRELLALLPRGNGKSRLAGTLAAHDLLTTNRPAIYIAAASRDQARVIFEYARDVNDAPSGGRRDRRRPPRASPTGWIPPSLGLGCAEAPRADAELRLPRRAPGVPRRLRLPRASDRDPQAPRPPDDRDLHRRPGRRLAARQAPRPRARATRRAAPPGAHGRARPVAADARVGDPRGAGHR